MQNNKPSVDTIREALNSTAEILKQYQAEDLHFKVSGAAETVARCYRLLEDNQQAHDHFVMAASAHLTALGNRLSQEEVELNAQWGYLFEALWCYYQAKEQQKVQELADRLGGLMSLWEDTIPLLERIEITLAYYAAGEMNKTRDLYQHFQFERYENTPHHPEVKLLKAGLYGDQDAARRAIEVARREIADDEIQPWYAHNLQYDLVAMAESLLDS